jgi:DNA-binding MarR family transcriptional regulator
MSVSQKIMGLIVKGPMTLGELAEALGKTETETKKSISPLISNRFVLRTRGLDETIEYKITPEGIEYHRRHLATLAPVERNDETPEHDAQPEAAAEESASVIAEPGPAEEHPLTEAQEDVTEDDGRFPKHRQAWDGRGLIRGGGWRSGKDAGAFALYAAQLYGEYLSVGFRATRPIAGDEA